MSILNSQTLLFPAVFGDVKLCKEVIWAGGNYDFCLELLAASEADISLQKQLQQSENRTYSHLASKIKLNASVAPCLLC